MVLRKWVSFTSFSVMIGSATCLLYSNLANPYLFKTVRFELTKSGCDALEQVAGYLALSLRVKNLVL